MGTGSGGITALRGGGALSENVLDLKLKFPVNSKGLFGRRGQGRGHTRNIDSNNPARTAAEFAGTASRSAVSSIPIEGKGMMYRMRDGSVISHRYTSRDGSPVVELRIKNTSGIRSQKIHFTKKGK